MEIKRMAKKQKIWDKEKKTEKSEKKAKKLVLLKFHQWIYVFREKASERILMREKKYTSL